MKKPKIIIRLSIYSDEDNSINSFDFVKSFLPKSTSSYVKGSEKISYNRKIHSKKRKETSFNFVSEFHSFSLEEVNNNFYGFLDKNADNFKIVKDKYNYKLLLSYEITVYDMNYPSMYLNNNNCLIINELGVDISFYFYHDNSGNGTKGNGNGTE